MAGKAYQRATRKDPIWFSVPDENDEQVRFDCRPSVPGGLILDMGGLEISTGPDTKKMVDEFMAAALDEEQNEKFQRMARDPQCGIDMNMLIDIIVDLGEQYTTRENPTSEQSASTSPKTASGGNLTGGVSPEVLTYSRSAATALST
jgi:hypothetical protein